MRNSHTKIRPVKQTCYRPAIESVCHLGMKLTFDRITTRTKYRFKFVAKKKIDRQATLT